MTGCRLDSWWKFRAVKPELGGCLRESMTVLIKPKIIILNYEPSWKSGFRNPVNQTIRSKGTDYIMMITNNNANAQVYAIQ